MTLCLLQADIAQAEATLKQLKAQPRYAISALQVGSSHAGVCEVILVLPVRAAA